MPLAWAIIVVSLFAIVVPILRGRADALTFWNIFLVGGINFTAIGCLEVVYGSFDWPQLQWFQPTRNDVHIFVIGTVLFYVTIFASYYLLARPIDRMTSGFLNKWPPMSLPLTLIMMAATLAVTVIAIACARVFFVGPLMTNVSQKVVVFGIVFAFCHWYQNKRLLPMLGMFIGLFVYCALFAMVTYVGRRMLMSIAIAPVVCMYWLKWRYASPKSILAGLAVAGAVAFGVAGFYGSFRHSREIYGARGDRTFGNVIKVVESASLSRTIDYLKSNSLHFFSQYTVHYSLLTIHLIESREIEVEPLNTIRFLATYPIPRSIWPGKPAGLGVRIVNEVLRLNVGTNWGLGVVGHCWHEGGYPVVVLYGFLMVVVIRLMDNAMRRHPNNWFLIATLTAGAPHILAWARGDTVNMSAEIMEAFMFVWLAGLVGRFIFGTESTARPANTIRPPLETLVNHSSPTGK